MRGRTYRVRQNRLERFWTPERFGDGARSARARMARVNLTLSATQKKGSIAEPFSLATERRVHFRDVTATVIVDGARQQLGAVFAARPA